MILLVQQCASYYQCLSDSCKSGQAKIKTKYCDLYEGEVMDGEPFGYGVMKYAGNECEEKGYTRLLGNTLYYKGMWGKYYDQTFKKEFTRWKGKGEVILNNGVVTQATFENDNCVDGTEGTIILPNGTKYTGVCKWPRFYKGNFKDGTGIQFDSSGYIMKGFDNGKCRVTYYDYYIEEGICKDGWLTSGTLTCLKKRQRYCENYMMGSYSERKIKVNLIFTDSLNY